MYIHAVSVVTDEKMYIYLRMGSFTGANDCFKIPVVALVTGQWRECAVEREYTYEYIAYGWINISNRVCVILPSHSAVTLHTKQLLRRVSALVGISSISQEDELNFKAALFRNEFFYLSFIF